MRDCCDSSRIVIMVVFVGSLTKEPKELLGDSRDEAATEKIYTVMYFFFSVINIKAYKLMESYTIYSTCA